MAMKKWSEESSDFLDALGGNAVNPLDQKKENTPAKAAKKTAEVKAKPEAEKKDDPNVKKKITTIHIEEETYKAFKKFSVEKEQSITDLLKAAMLDMLAGTYYPKGLK